MTEQKPQNEELMDSLPITTNYVNNEQFSNAIHEYNLKKKKAIEEGLPLPRVTEYIGSCFIKMSEGMAMRANFNRYTYKQEMINDGVENCLRYIGNYDLDKETRTGSPNAFFYFSQIIYYAFVRRIKKENKQTEIKNAIIESMDIYTFTNNSMDKDTDSSDVSSRTHHAHVENMINQKIHQ